jgi:hypothetical protein
MNSTPRTHQNHREHLPVSTILRSIDGHLQMISPRERLNMKLETNTVGGLLSALVDNLVREINVDARNMIYNLLKNSTPPRLHNLPSLGQKT